jgi:prepilin-type N-terminal cleavage/methylation domain-containing protein
MSIKAANHRKSGFSLFELLFTVAIIGLLGSVAIAAFGDQRGAVENTRDLRNAGEIVSVCTTASAAGLNFVTSDGLDATIRKIIQGAAPKGGAFKNRFFKVNLIDEADIAGAMRFLEIKNGDLVIRHDS